MSGKAKMTRAGGKMAPAFMSKGESKTAKPAHQKTLGKASESAKRMMADKSNVGSGRVPGKRA